MTDPKPLSASSPASKERRYDIDWLRVLAMGLLMIYHVMISFQPWAEKAFFIKNEESLTGPWIVMELINVWRIPILFMVSGMGVCFAMERRNWKQLLKDRTLRILVPLVFGFFFICPVSVFVAVNYFDHKWVYLPNTGHLWFLANIFAYVLLFLPLLTYLKNHPANRFFKQLSRLLKHPSALLLAALPLMLEAWLVNPEFFASYAKSAHGFWIGGVSFFVGFTFVSLKSVFWQAVEKFRHRALLLAFLLYLIRVLVFHVNDEANALIAFESMSWMLAILGYGSVHLNTPSPQLTYFSQAVYPVYMVHMPVQYALSYFLLPLSWPAPLKMIILLIGTVGICLLSYEYIIKKTPWLRPLFGLPIRKVRP